MWRCSKCVANVTVMTGPSRVGQRREDKVVRLKLISLTGRQLSAAATAAAAQSQRRLVAAPAGRTSLMRTLTATDNHRQPPTGTDGAHLERRAPRPQNNLPYLNLNFAKCLFAFYTNTRRVCVAPKFAHPKAPLLLIRVRLSDTLDAVWESRDKRRPLWPTFG